MIQEKKRLLSDGVLTDNETHYFMKKYRYRMVEEIVPRFWGGWVGKKKGCTQNIRKLFIRI